MATINRKLLQCIADYTDEHDCPPTMEEIRQAMDYPFHVTSLWGLTVLARYGLIRYTANIARGRRITEKGRKYLKDNTNGS